MIGRLNHVAIAVPDLKAATAVYRDTPGPRGPMVPAGRYTVKLTVDKGSAHTIPFSWCLTNTCIAGEVVSPALLHELENGKSLTVEVVDTNMLAVTTSLPLDKFAAVRQGAPAKVFEQALEE